MEQLRPRSQEVVEHRPINVIENKGNKNVKIAFLGTEEYRAALQQEALNRKMKVQGLLERAVASYTSGATPEPTRPTLIKHELHPEETELLRYILDQGTKDDAGWIRGNLKNFAEAIRSRGRTSKTKRDGGK